MKFLRQLLLLTGFSALSAALILAHLPAALPALPSGGGKAVEITDALKQAAIKGSGILEISQDEINRHLHREWKPSAAPKTPSWLQTTAPRVELTPKQCRLHLAWNLGSLERTACIDLDVQRLNQAFRIEVLGGAYGRLPVPRGLLRPLLPALSQLRANFDPEIQALFQMNDIRIAQGKVVLDPRIP